MQVLYQLRLLRLHQMLSPLHLALLAIYVTGIILLDKRQSAVRIARWLPSREHDALNRLLRSRQVGINRLMQHLCNWASHLGEGYLTIDDVVVSKPYSRVCRWVGWTWSTSEKRKVRGFHIVVLVWCHKRLRIPVAFRIWRPKRACSARNYRKKTELAAMMLREVAQSNLPVSYVVGDTLYSGNRLYKLTKRLGWQWVGVLHPKTTLLYRGHRTNAADIVAHVKLKWRHQLGLRAVGVTAYAPSYGHLRLAVTKNRHGNVEVIACSNLQADLTTLVRRKRKRWSIETVFRDTKQSAALAACQCRVDDALVRHIAFVLVTFIVLQLLGLHRQETVGETKERLQLSVIQQNAMRPRPLKGRVAASQLLTA